MSMNLDPFTVALYWSSAFFLHSLFKDAEFVDGMHFLSYKTFA